MSKDISVIPQEGKPIFCWRCGRAIYINTITQKTGCRNTKCRGYLIGSKHIDLKSGILQKFISGKFPK